MTGTQLFDWLKMVKEKEGSLDGFSVVLGIVGTVPYTPVLFCRAGYHGDKIFIHTQTKLATPRTLRHMIEDEKRLSEVR